MKKSSHLSVPAHDKICTLIKTRKKGGKTRVYWRELWDGKKVQREFYWGNLPTEKLDSLMAVINGTSMEIRKKIAKMVGLRINYLGRNYLIYGNFLRIEILERLKAKEKAKYKELMIRNLKYGPDSPVARLLISISQLKNKYLSLARERPMETWDESDLETVIREGKPLAAMMAKLKEMLDTRSK